MSEREEKDGATLGVPSVDWVKTCAPVLARAVELLGKEGNGKMKFGAAIEEAAREVGVKLSEVPEGVQQGMLVAAFKIISSGRIPGAPDA